MAKNDTVLFDPINEIIYPKDRVPISAPQQLIEPIQEISAEFNGPDDSGVLSDWNVESAGASQPE